ncbi:TPA: hypothetical protein NJ339_001729 [Vibrio parahaemolyticus]|uniref:hypothetical protein n=1 Tax=Vibrio parahaemolyticus TaxID=670 RepID=UPI001122F7E2|nr:hypothetical protein [Vibrio parahaemolyticus]TOE70467.1 hypothetical protein CGJ36_24705 [Vibrio parahaemolyticus]HCG6609742.1 hypothetical protein [Vibrio parahaemolyticus]HCG7076218.1 hypothetical protein [Vibrio parahaemolyticus]
MTKIDNNFLFNQVKINHFKLFGVIASDIIKVGLAALITSITLKTMISVGVIAAGGSAALFVFVGVVAGFATSKIDEEYNLTERF